MSVFANKYLLYSRNISHYYEKEKKYKLETCVSFKVFMQLFIFSPN